MDRYLKILIFFALWAANFGFVHGIEFDRDLGYTYEGHKNSLIDWEQVEHEEWMDLDRWKKERAIKDQYPDWKTRLREQRLHEPVGRVLECVGPCKLYRADTVNDVDYRSKIIEGDEIRTLEGGYLWIFLFDGTLVRLSPESSITFKEINLAKTQVFHHARINHGNVVWLTRVPLEHKELERRETDSIFFPLSLYEANPPSPERPPEDFHAADLLEAYERRQSPLSRQVDRLNKLVKENQEEISFKDSYAFLVMPNGTVEGKNPMLEFIVLPGEKSYFKQRLPENVSLKKNSQYEEQSELTFRYRGYENEKTFEVVQQAWHEVAGRGRRISLVEEGSARRFYFGELLSKRIPTFMVARELWLKKYGEVLTLEKAPQLARQGYRLWGVQKTKKGETDLTLRKQFLREYTRRFETYHLNTLRKYHQKLKEQGEEMPSREYSDRFYRRAFDSYVTEGIGESRTFESDRRRLHSETRELWKRMQNSR